MKFFFKLKFCLIFFSIFSPLFCLAASQGVPVRFVLFQALNFAIFSWIIIYLAIKKIPPVLKIQYEDYIMNKKQAKKMYEQAYKELKETQNKIAELEKKETLFQEELDGETQKIENLMTLELSSQKEAIQRSFQNVIDLERISLNQKLKEEYLNQILSLCEKQSRAKPYGFTSLVHKISQKNIKFKQGRL